MRLEVHVDWHVPGRILILTCLKTNQPTIQYTSYTTTVRWQYSRSTGLGGGGFLGTERDAGGGGGGGTARAGGGGGALDATHQITYSN